MKPSGVVALALGLALLPIGSTVASAKIADAPVQCRALLSQKHGLVVLEEMARDLRNGLKVALVERMDHGGMAAKFPDR